MSLLEDPAQKLEVAESLALLYEGPLDDPKAAVRVLDIERELDPENFDAVQRLCELCERLEDWPRVATFLGVLAEVEGDEEEVSKMIRRMAEILHEKVGKSDEALAVLIDVADRGDEACRKEYVALGDKLGWKGVVATKLVEWYMEAPVGPARNGALKGAFERFVSVGREADAAAVAKELARTRGADSDIAKQLEEIAVKLKDLDALGIAHDLMVAELSGPARAEEMVRQAEVLLRAEVSVDEALHHGEQALTSVTPAEVEPLLQRLSKLAPDQPAQAIGIYERQVTRCKAPSDKLAALGRAASVAAEHGVYDKARAFFDLALATGAQEETLSLLEDVALKSDRARGVDTLRRTLADAMAAGGQGSRDGGRTRGILLGRAAALVYRELKDIDKAFGWLGDAIVTHVDDERLDALEALASDVGDARRAETVLTRALEEVFDGPLVRKLLARRASLRRDKLADKVGAAGDLKRLHDLSPSDTTVMAQLSELYTELADYRGMVQLFEDQILRGKDPGSRAELARKVARLWEEKLDDPREAADAWRRVLRMKAGDPEGTEGLERAKLAMLKRPKEDSEPKAPAAPAPVQNEPEPEPKPVAAPSPQPEFADEEKTVEMSQLLREAALREAMAHKPEPADDDKTVVGHLAAASLQQPPTAEEPQKAAIEAAAEPEKKLDAVEALPQAPVPLPAVETVPAEVAAPPSARQSKLAPPPKPKKGSSGATVTIAESPSSPLAAEPPPGATAEVALAPAVSPRAAADNDIPVVVGPDETAARSSTPPPLPGSEPQASRPPLPSRNAPPPPPPGSATRTGGSSGGASARPPLPAGASKGAPPPPPKGAKGAPPPPPGSRTRAEPVDEPTSSDAAEARPSPDLNQYDADDDEPSGEFSVDDEELIDDQPH